MTILYIGYWGINEGLSSSTIVPHLKILSTFEDIDRIIYCSIERSTYTNPLDILKVTHVPLVSKNIQNVFLNKFSDFVFFTGKLRRICIEEKIHLIICRSSLAGSLGYLVWKSLKIPYIVESFEPHARYMVESNIWKRYDPRFWIQQYLEEKQKQTALYLLPVSNHYTQNLIEEGVNPNKLITLPCCVDLQNFFFNNIQRQQVRNKLLISEQDTVGIYVGKYGGIYYEREAFILYKKAFVFFGRCFRLIILSSDDHDKIRRLLQEENIPLSKVYLANIPHEDVNTYLSAADFAFSTIKPSPSRIYCSPIKNGEYWANGLPILLEPGIGDDSDIINNEGGGVIVNRLKYEEAFERIRSMLIKGRENVAREIRQIARKHRNLNRIEEVYDKIIHV